MSPTAELWFPLSNYTALFSCIPSDLLFKGSHLVPPLLQSPPCATFWDDDCDFYHTCGVVAEIQMKNSSTCSSLFLCDDSGLVHFSAVVLSFCTTVLLPQPFMASFIQPAEPHVLEGPWGHLFVRGRHSLSSLARPSAPEAPTAAGLSEWRVIQRSMEEERVIALTAVSERGETGTPVSTLVSGSSSSSSRRRCERERVMEGRRGESGWLEVKGRAGLLRWDE